MRASRNPYMEQIEARSNHQQDAERSPGASAALDSCASGDRRLAR
jgi:hypothetical protein